MNFDEGEIDYLLLTLSLTGFSSGDGGFLLGIQATDT